MAIEWNSIRLSDPAHGIVTKIVHKTLPGGGGDQGIGGSRGQGVVGGQRVRVLGWVSRW